MSKKLSGYYYGMRILEMIIVLKSIIYCRSDVFKEGAEVLNSIPSILED